MENETTSLDVTDRAPTHSQFESQPDSQMLLRKIDENESVTKLNKVENHKRKLSADSENNTLVINSSPTLSSPNGISVKNDTSFEKIKKWYNINFMNKSPNANGESSANIKTRNASNKMDNRHSWHLNSSTEM